VCLLISHFIVHFSFLSLYVYVYFMHRIDYLLPFSVINDDDDDDELMMMIISLLHDRDIMQAA